MSYIPSNVAYGGLLLGSDGKVASAQLKALLADINGLSLSSGDLLYYGGTNIIALATGSAGRDLLADATAGDQRTTLGLGTIATQDANNVSITGGSISGVSVSVSYSFHADVSSTATFNRSALNGKTVHVDASGGNVTMNLQAVSNWTDGDWFKVKLINNASNTTQVIIDPASSETIDGAATKTLQAAMESVTVYVKSGAFYCE